MLLNPPQDLLGSCMPGLDIQGILSKAASLRDHLPQPLRRDVTSVFRAGQRHRAVLIPSSSQQHFDPSTGGVRPRLGRAGPALTLPSQGSRPASLGTAQRQ